MLCCPVVDWLSWCGQVIASYRQLVGVLLVDYSGFVVDGPQALTLLLAINQVFDDDVQLVSGEGELFSDGLLHRDCSDGAVA